MCYCQSNWNSVEIKSWHFGTWKHSSPCPVEHLNTKFHLLLFFSIHQQFILTFHIALNWWLTDSTKENVSNSWWRDKCLAIKLNGEVTFVPMGHCTVTTNTTDMHSQTEVKCKLTDTAKDNMHSE